MLALLLAAALPLFNGKDLTGWLHEGSKPSFTAAEGEIRCGGQGNFPNWLRTTSEYENFRLEFEYRLAQWGETAVVMRAPRAGRPSQSGIAIVLTHDYHNVTNEHVTGAVAGVLPPEKALPPSFEVWHRASIVLDGAKLTAAIDGTRVQEVALDTHPELRYRLRRGFIGFQDLGYAFRVRNIVLEDLGGREKYVDLFDGRSLAGWKLRNGGNWAVRDGAIHAHNGHGILYAPGTFADFELTVEARSRNRVNSGVFLRGEAEGPNRGFEIQIYSPIDAVYPTGSIYGLRRSSVTADYEDRWFHMQVIVRGGTCVVRLDGTTVAEADALPESARSPGRIGLQVHSDEAGVEFRSVRVRPL